MGSALQTSGNGMMVGTVSSVDPASRTAKVIFSDRADLVSGDLKIMQNTPTITIERWTENPDADEKWEYEAHYHCADRKLGLGEVYEKGTQTSARVYSEGVYQTYLTGEPDVIKNELTIHYKKKFDIGGKASATTDGASVPTITNTGIIEDKKHRQTVTVYPWLPYIGQLVVCAFFKNGGDGIVLGGL
jgi:hypothetical protein